MRSLAISFCCALLLAFAGTWTAAPAHADKSRQERGRDHDFVGRLTQEELALLKKKIPTWDQLDARKKNRIALHVLRLRDMGPKEQAQFRKRIERMRDLRKTQGHPKHRKFASAMAVIGQAMESMLATDWPEGLKLAEERQWSRGRFIGSFMRHMLIPRAAEFELQRLEAEGVDLATHFKDLEGAKRQKILGAIERAANGDKAARRMLGGMLAHLRMRTLSKALRAQVDTSDAYSQRLAEQLRAAWSEPYAQALADVRANVDRFVMRVETPRGSRGPVRPREWAQLARTLDEVATRSAKSDPALAKDADGLMMRVLRDHLKVPAAQIESLPPRTDPQRKRAFLRVLMPHLRGAKGAASDGRGFPGRGKRGRPGMREDWKQKLRERAKKRGEKRRDVEDGK